MTLTAPPPPTAPNPVSTSQLWSTMPGWGITANLLPPEVVAARRLGAIRKMIAAGLALVVVLSGAGYAYAVYQQDGAQSALDAEHNRTAALLAQQNKYSTVVTLSGSIADIQSQLATLMASDVDTAHLATLINGALPAGASITQFTAKVDGGSGSSAGTTTSGSDAGVLDSSGQAHIGSLSLTGTARRLTDIAQFVRRLSTLPGVVGVFPSSQTQSGKAAQFTIALDLTDKLLTHRFDTTGTAPTGGS